MKFKLNWRFWFFTVLFGSIQPLGYYFLWSVSTQGLNDESGKEDSGVTLFVLCAVAICLLSYLITVINLLSVWVKNKGYGLSITDKGIENTFIVCNFLALFIVVPVKLMPWDAVIQVHNEDDGLFYVRVDKHKVKTSFLGQALIGISGYHFCQGFVKPQVAWEDVKNYLSKFN